MAIFGSKSNNKSSSQQTSSGTQTSSLTAGSRQALLDRMNQIQGRGYQGLDPTAYQAFESPYQQEVIDKTTADIMAARAQEANAARQAMLARPGGAMSDRRGVAEAELGGRYDRTLATTLAGLRQSGYQQALGVAQQENTNKNQYQASIDQQLNQLLALLANDRVITSNSTGSQSGRSSGTNFGFTYGG